jgi:hypothetical protein
MRVTMRQIETTIVQHAQDLRDGATLQKELENKVKPVLSGDVRILARDTARVPHKTDGQAERKFATLRLCDKTSRQAASHRVRLKLGYGSLEAEKPASIGASTIADAIPISDKTLSQPRECRGEGVSRNSCGRDASRRLT